MATRAEIQQLVDNLVAGYQPEKVILFGSHAYGTPGPDSDVDLFVIKDDPRPRFQRQLDARLALGYRSVPVDLIVYTPFEVSEVNPKYSSLMRDIFTKGKTLYENA
jgi:predicted nucleotidyltransferase